jgi:hypothetical protein
MMTIGKRVSRRDPCARWRPAVAGVLLVAATACTSTGTSDDDHGAVASPRPMGSATPTEAHAPALTSPVEAQSLPERHGAVLRGAYAVPFSGWGDIPPEVAELRAIITLPAGFAVDDGSTIVEIGSSSRRLGFWTVAKVASDFCTAGNNAFTDPGSTVADLATALAHQPRLSGTDPVPITIGRYDGLYVELTRPAARCPGTVLWLAPRIRHTAYHDRFTRSGDVARFWILNVGSDRVVINTIHSADASDAEVAELNRIVESAMLAKKT